MKTTTLINSIAVLICLLSSTYLSAADPKQEIPPNLNSLLKKLLIANLPNPLHEQKMNWDHQREYVVGLKWHREGILLKPEPQMKMLNEGTWRKLSVTADQAAQKLEFAVGDFQPLANATRFSINITCPVHFELEQQIWERGRRIYSGSVRGRCRVGIAMRCELTTTQEFPKGSWLPVFIIKPKVLDARLGYDQIVIEHTLGVGGEAAKILGQTTMDLIKQVRPDLEKNLLTQANQAIIKAGSNKELRLQFDQMMFSKKPSISK